MRGLAAIIVALMHSPFLFNERHSIIAQGSIFVDYFFVLSGFVMAHAYTHKIEGGLRALEFIKLRVIRLYPLHLVLLIIWSLYVLAKAYAFFGLGIGSNPFVMNNWFTFLSNLLLINSMGVNDTLSWNYPAWSISVELFTYIVFFIFVYYRRLNSTVSLMLVSALSYTALYVLTQEDNTLLSTYKYGFVRCLGGFFLGTVTYRLSKKIKLLGARRVLANFFELTSLSLMLVCVYLSGSSKLFQLLSFSSFAFMILVFSIQSQGILSRILEFKALLFVGKISYSIYLIHALIFALACNIYQYILKLPVVIVEPDIRYVDVWYADIINFLCISITLILSSYTYKYIETHFRQRYIKN